MSATTPSARETLLAICPLLSEEDCGSLLRIVREWQARVVNEQIRDRQRVLSPPEVFRRVLGAPVPLRLVGAERAAALEALWCVPLVVPAPRSPPWSSFLRLTAPRCALRWSKVDSYAPGDRFLRTSPRSNSNRACRAFISTERDC